MVSSKVRRIGSGVVAAIDIITFSICLAATAQAQNTAAPQSPFTAQQAEFGKTLNALYQELQKQAGPPGPNMEAWAGPAEPFKILGNLYSVGPVYGESFLLTSPQGHILLGAAMEKAADVVQKNIETLGFKMSDVKAILLTHNHGDMSGGAAALKAKSGAQLMAGFAEVPYIEHGMFNPPAIPGPNPVTPPRYPAAKVDRALFDGDIVKVGPLNVTIFLFPGHSPSPASFLFNVKDSGHTYRVFEYCCWEYPMDLRSGYVTEASVRHTFETLRKKAYPIDVYLASASFQWGGVLNQPSGTLAERVARVKADPKLWINREIFNGLAAFHEVQFEQELAKMNAAATSIQ